MAAGTRRIFASDENEARARATSMAGTFTTAEGRRVEGRVVTLIPSGDGSYTVTFESESPAGTKVVRGGVLVWTEITK